VNAHDVDKPRVLTGEGRTIVHVPGGRGEELRIHLETHGIKSVVRPAAQAPYERLEVEDGADPEALQALVDHWER
jgi:hypothetical protein